jgi:preprotein translocase subunit SecD
VRTTLRNEQIEFGELGEAGGVVGSASPIRARWNEAAACCAVTSARRWPARSAVATLDRHARQPAHGDLSFVAEAAKADAAKAVEQSIETIRRRIDSLGTKEPTITRQGTNRIVIQAAGESDPEKLKNIIGQTAKLTFQMVDETVTQEDMIAGRIPPGVDRPAQRRPTRRRSRCGSAPW